MARHNENSPCCWWLTFWVTCTEAHSRVLNRRWSASYCEKLSKTSVAQKSWQIWSEAPSSNCLYAWWWKGSWLVSLWKRFGWKQVKNSVKKPQNKAKQNKKTKTTNKKPHQPTAKTKQQDNNNNKQKQNKNSKLCKNTFIEICQMNWWDERETQSTFRIYRFVSRGYWRPRFCLRSSQMTKVTFIILVGVFFYYFFFLAWEIENDQILTDQ